MAVTLVPLKNQTSQTIQQDSSACQTQANAQFPIQSTVPTGGRVKGATTAAVAGATAAQVRDRQYDVYDEIDDDVKQDYRQNNARSAAAAGAVIGASRQRQERRQTVATNQQNITANNSVFSSCLQQRGYNVLP
jgi:hypothetical protein